MKRTISVLAGMLLAATMCGTAFAGHGHGKGPKGNGNGNSQAGGLPALAQKVAALQTLVDTLQGDVTTLQGQVSTLQGQVGTLQGQVSDLQGQNNFAVVKYDGSVIRNSGAPGSVTVTHSTTGIFEVLFSDKDVSGCSYQATLGDTGTAVPAPTGFVSVSGDSSNVDGVIVQTYNSSLTATDESFHLYVSCP